MKKLFEILFGDLSETLAIGLATTLILFVVTVVTATLAIIIKYLVINFLPLITCILIMFSLFLCLLILGIVGKFILYIWNKCAEKIQKKYNKNNESDISEEKEKK